MRITLLGATGRIGRLALAAAVAAGHDITILVRRPIDVHPAGVIAIVGDISDDGSLREAVAGRDAVISALGPRSNTVEARDQLVTGMRALVLAMQAARVERLVALSGAAVDVPGDRKPLLDRLATRIVRLAAGQVVAAKQGEFDVFSASPLAWTALRPALVVDGSARGYRLSDRLRPGARVTREDVGQALVDVLGDDTQFRKAPFVLPR